MRRGNAAAADAVWWLTQKKYYFIRSLLTQCIGVIQMINKIDFDEEIGVFLDEDVEVLETFAKFVGEKLHASTLLSGGKSKARGPNETFGSTMEEVQVERKRTADAPMGPGIIEEEDE